MRPPPVAGQGLDPRFAVQASAGFAHLQARRFAEATAALAPLAAVAPNEPDLRRAYAEALLGLGDLVRAEVEARAALATDKRRAPSWATLANVLAAAGRFAEAEKALRQALTLDRRFGLAAVRLNRLLLREGRLREAAQATAALAATTQDAAVLAAHAEALKADRRYEESLAYYMRARDADPAGGAGEHNVASLLADLHRYEDALAAADRAFAAGLDAPVTWLVRAHALQGLDRLDEAEGAYAEVLWRDPRMAAAVTDLARLVWMRTGDVARAVAVYDRAMAAGACEPSLFVDKARLLEYAGEPRAALVALASVLADADDTHAHIAAAQIAAPLDPDLAAHHAEAVVAAAPRNPRLRLHLAEARLAQGRAAEAAGLAADALAVEPYDQSALAVQATAWRLLGDPRYAELYDYEAFVGAATIETPSGWSDLASYLADLAAALTRLHTLTTHPVGQSLRQGTQTSVNLREVDDPAIQAAFVALDAPIRAYVARLGKGRDPVRSRARGGYRYAGAWSARLKPGGRHVDHVHPQGWLSSAFYVDLPPAVGAGGREGWIKFGEPGLPHGPRHLEPQHWVKPEAGKLVLFPSYMWHGTAPFGGEVPRLTMAFDLVPA